MAFQFSEAHIEQFQTQGYTIFRGILPPTLIDDLRRVCDKAAAVERQRSVQSQRFHTSAFEGADRKPFEDYRDLPALRDALDRVLGPQFSRADEKYTSVLIEPGELPWSTQWHRDWRDNIPGVDMAEFKSVQNDAEMFNQVNCALYEDSCTWIVPGSHNRSDTLEEARRFPQRPIAFPEIEGKTYAERERICFEYCQSMPGAMQAFLQAGDFMLYRSVLWHIGNYLPYKKRATLHEGVITPRFGEYWNETVRKTANATKMGQFGTIPTSHCFRTPKRGLYPRFEKRVCKGK